MKKCVVCQIEKPLSEYYFNKSHNGYIGTCKSCSRKKWSKKQLDQILLKWGFKLCRVCGVIKPLREFSKHSARSTGASYDCLECESIRHQSYYIDNKEKILDYNKNWRAENPDKYKIIQAKSDLKKHARRKSWGVNPLNEYFDGAEFHHLHLFGDTSIGIWIPKELHKSIPHSSTTWHGMEEINDKAIKFLNGEIK
jgi:hypothetical protein